MQALIPLAVEYAVKIQNGVVQFKWFIQEYWTGTAVLVCVYNTLVGLKQIEPIESLPVEEKARLKAIMKSWGTGNTENQMRQVKAIYLVEQLTEKKTIV